MELFQFPLTYWTLSTKWLPQRRKRVKPDRSFWGSLYRSLSLQKRRIISLHNTRKRSLRKISSAYRIQTSVTNLSFSGGKTRGFKIQDVSTSISIDLQNPCWQWWWKWKTVISMIFRLRRYHFDYMSTYLFTYLSDCMLYFVVCTLDSSDSTWKLYHPQRYFKSWEKLQAYSSSILLFLTSMNLVC